MEESIVSEEIKSDFQVPTVEELFNAPTDAPKEKVKETVKEEPTKEQEEVIENPEEPVEEAVDWETEVTTWKEKAEKAEKQYRDATSWGNRAHMKLKELGLDDYQDEMIAEEEKSKLAFNERERASKAVAVELYGQEYVDKMLYAEDAPFKKLLENPSNYHRVVNSDAPVMESIKILKETEFFDKYGRDIEKIPDKIKKELEAELREKITKEFQKKLSKKTELTKTLTGIKGVEKSPDSNGFRPPSTAELFG